MLNFYDVDTIYADFLRQHDAKVPFIKYADRDKFVCGIVFEINGFQYFAPVSSKIGKQQTSFIIKDDDGTPLSSIMLNFMFPAPASVVTPKNFKEIAKADAKYARLLQKEYEYCKSHENQILCKAQKVYKIAHNPSHFLNQFCCNFSLLEQKSVEYTTAATTLPDAAETSTASVES